MSLYSLTLFLAFVLNFLIGVFVYFKNIKNPINKSFLLLILVLDIWILGCFAESIVKDKNIALIWDKVLYFGVCVYPIALLNFFFDIVNKKKNSKLFISLSIGCLIYLIFNFSPFLRKFFIKDVVKKYPFRFISVPNFLWYLLVIIEVLVCIYGLYLIFINLTKSKGIEKIRLSYLLISYIILTIGGVMYFLLPLNIKVPPIDAATVVIFSLITSYAILKYQLLDIKIAVTRVSIFVIVYLFVLGFPFWFGIVSGNWLLSTVFMAILATLGPFLYSRVRYRVEERILKEEHHMHEVLMQAST